MDINDISTIVALIIGTLYVIGIYVYAIIKNKKDETNTTKTENTTKEV